MSTPTKDLLEIRHELQQHAPRHRNNPLYRHLLRESDVPWMPSWSAVAGWFDQVGLGPQLVANSSADYVALASRLAMDRLVVIVVA